jgi:hypothetical protein
MIHQLRIYEIFEHNKAAFHARYRDHGWRIMRTYGFELVAAWETQYPHFAPMGRHFQEFRVS